MCLRTVDVEIPQRIEYSIKGNQFFPSSFIDGCDPPMVTLSVTKGGFFD